MTNNDDMTEFLQKNLGPKRAVLPLVISMTVLYTVILLTGVVGNICTCLVIARNKYMHTATNYYLFSLSISDVLLLILGLPQEIYLFWQNYPYIFGESFCIIRGLTSETSTNASILTITAFTVERYLAICHPLLAHRMSQLSRAIKIIVIIWMVAALCSIPVVFQLGIVYQLTNNKTVIVESATCGIKRELPHIFEVSTFLFFFLPITVITFLYILIGLRLRRFTVGQAESSSELTRSCGNHYSSRRAVVKMLVAVVVSFFICWCPFHAQRLAATYIQETPMAQMPFLVLTYISGVMYYLSATINPILYQLMSLKFRQAFHDTFGSCMRCLGPQDLPQITFSAFGNNMDGSRLPFIKGISFSCDNIASFIGRRWPTASTISVSQRAMSTSSSALNVNHRITNSSNNLIANPRSLLNSRTRLRSNHTQDVSLCVSIELAKKERPASLSCLKIGYLESSTNESLPRANRLSLPSLSI
ncbi:pyrokinin-1 receptor-like [Limulus polyphemus]|uniref:Pyrokinin-1 receptor-like n=1 Tax=Limulus polyphemus TaxID=6850 RepID=A0ABM1B2G8_LIMPO|nr:pyrokinin-1 receptor-like [Limulus polyphemus]